MVSAANCLRLGLIFNFISCSAMFRRFLVDPIAVSGNSYKRNPRAAIDNHPYGWETAYYEVPIDNFAFIQNFTYPMKYLYNITFYKPGGPIFFYTGNEGLIEDFAKNTGIMFDLAPMFNAALLFAQHRYYAHPLPFGNFTFTDVKYLAYLDSTQALADFAKLIPYVKSSLLNCSDETPVIAFGGSYGGELAAWMRIKYAHIITGAWSASAPLAYYKGGGVSPGAFDHVVMRDFLDAGCKEKTIINGLDALISLANTTDGLTFLNDLFRIDPMSQLNEPTDAYDLIAWIQQAFGYMAMVDYPYPSSFITPLPGWPVNYACKYAQEEITDPKLAATVLYEMSNVFYNYSGDLPTNCVNYTVCGDTVMNSISAPGTQMSWPWQICTELITEVCSEGPPNDFFSDQCSMYGGPQEQMLISCMWSFWPIGYNEILFDPNAIPIEYGHNYAAASNIIFTNGKLDPWSSGGIYENAPGIRQASKNGVYTFLIEGAAHHLDLRQPNTCDPLPVVNARFQIVNIIKCWVNPQNCSAMPEATPLPPLGPLATDDCRPIFHGYPWGQERPKGEVSTSSPHTTASSSVTLKPTLYFTTLTSILVVAFIVITA